MATANTSDTKQPTNQPMPMPIPPAPEVAWASELMPPDRMQMIEKETAKLENRLSRRSNSCAYPMLWRTLTSSFLSTSVYDMWICSPLISSSAHQAGRGRAPYLLYPMLPDICHTPGLAPGVPTLARNQGERLMHNTSS